MLDTVVSPAQAFAHFFEDEKIRPAVSALTQRMLNGHVCLDLNQHEWLEQEGIDIKEITSALEQSVWVAKDDQDIKPFVLYNNRLYTHRNFTYETIFLESIRQFIRYESIQSQVEALMNYKEVILRTLFPHNGEESTNWQLVACVCSFIHRFSMITGGPGTGKTTTVSRLLMLYLLQNPEYTIRLAAPTGKAASRMKESLGQSRYSLPEGQQDIPEELLHKLESLEASTIHSLLGYRRNSIHFKHHRERPIDADILVVDESSMIDIALFKKLLEAIDPQRTRLILLGDKNQLASVEAGSLFGDLCAGAGLLNQFNDNYRSLMKAMGTELPESKPNVKHTLLTHHVVELQKSYRFSDSKGIGRFSKAIMNNDKELLRDFIHHRIVDEQIAIVSPEQTEVLENFVENLLQAYIHEEDVLKALQQINKYKIICATREGENGVYELNARVAQSLRNSDTKVAEYPSTTLFPNQVIMVNKNQPELGIYNGDIGLIREEEQDERGKRKLYAYFPSAEKGVLKILPARISEWESAFAITIHKSQGSEFDEVLICLPKKEGSQLLTRELVYTAVTRAKRKVILMGAEEIILKSAEREVQRISGIRERLGEI